MPEPKKRMSVARSKKRRSAKTVAASAVAKCAKCGKPSVAHRLCRICAKSV